MDTDSKRAERVERVKKSVAEKEAKRREEYQNIKDAPKNLTEFKAKYPDAKHIALFDSKTASTYLAGDYVWMFDSHKDDEHLAFMYDKNSRKTLYECDCIKRGREIVKQQFGIDFSFEAWIDALLKVYGGKA